jgi:hypothetical protein
MADPTQIKSEAAVEAAASAATGQRRVNLLWEATQSVIALSVTTATLYTATNLALQDQTETAAFLLLSNGFFLVIGFYFGRTNHARTGGVGGSDVKRSR